jgi:hypothetical protein
VGIEDFEERTEAVGMAVMGRGREEQAVLEAWGQVADGAGEAGVDGVTGATGGRGVVRPVEDEQRARAQVVQPVTQGADVGLVDQ